MRELINRPDWVAGQYASDCNLNARIALHKRFSTSDIEWTHWVFDRISEQIGNFAEQPIHLLELGAGPGNLWVENGERLPSHWHVILSDLSCGMALSASNNLSTADIRAEIMVAGAERIPLKSQSVHAVVANHMLYHVPQRGNALAEIRGVLKPNGVLLAATNGERHLHELHDLIRRFDRTYAMEDQVPRQFSLENGVGQLGEFFTDVTVIRKENALVVTEVEPLVAYILSGSPADVPPDRRTELREFVANEMAAKGAIRITPETGLLIARN